MGKNSLLEKRKRGREREEEERKRERREREERRRGVEVELKRLGYVTHDRQRVRGGMWTAKGTSRIAADQSRANKKT